MENLENKSPTKENKIQLNVDISKLSTLTNGKQNVISPPNPLIARIHIPLISPKFGNNTNYIKLKSFAKNEDENSNITHNTPSSIDRFEKFIEIDLYIHSKQFFDNIVYLRNEKTSDNKLSLDNNINLKSYLCNNSFYAPKNSETIYSNCIPQYYTLKDSNDTTLMFESRFESGNLLVASRVSENEYQLLLSCDTNTVGYTQWFFFKVTNVRKNKTVKFNLINQMKSSSLYNKGMKILIYSEKKCEEENTGWFRGGKDIDFYRNGLFRLYKDSKKMFSSLVFSYEFTHDDDTVYFANNIPYTFTDLNKELIEYDKNEKKYHFLSRKTLCSTLAGNSVDYLTIVSSEDHEDISSRPGIVIMARVHPGETVSSWMMKGVIEFLTSNEDEAVFIRRNYVVKLIPMLNPDGVILGNYRTSLAGCDLNRRWLVPNQTLHPEIFYAKKMITNFAKGREISLICDLHGHSGLHNIFIYGNRYEDDNSSCKIFPIIMSKINKAFWFGNCCFKMQKFKQGCARINLFNELGFTNIFTMEASFSGCKYGAYENMHISTSMLKSVGRDLLLAVLIYNNKNETDNLLYIKKNPITNLKIDKSVLIEELKSKDKMEAKEDDDSNGSDSEPSCDGLDNEMLNNLMPVPVEKKVKIKSPILIRVNRKKLKEIKEIPFEKPVVKELVMEKPVIKELILEKPVIKDRIVKAKSLVNPTRISENRRQSALKFSEKINIDMVVKKYGEDAETQTEDIFFKMPWTFFKERNFKIITSQIEKRVITNIDANEKKIIPYNLLNGRQTVSLFKKDPKYLSCSKIVKNANIRKYNSFKNNLNYNGGQLSKTVMDKSKTFNK